MPISYAVGYALAEDFEGCTMRELFRYADKNMYIDKNQAKIKEAADRRALHIQILDGIRPVTYTHLKKVMSMFTDPNHLRVEDPGQVEGNPVFIYLDAFCKDEYFEEFWPEYKNLDELKAHYQRGGLGDVKVKKFLNKVLQAELAPIRARRKEWEQKLPEVFAILKEGSKAAEAKAAETLQLSLIHICIYIKCSD